MKIKNNKAKIILSLFFPHFFLEKFLVKLYSFSFKPLFVAGIVVVVLETKPTTNSSNLIYMFKHPITLKAAIIKYDQLVILELQTWNWKLRICRVEATAIATKTQLIKIKFNLTKNCGIIKFKLYFFPFKWVIWVANKFFFDWIQRIIT